MNWQDAQDQLHDIITTPAFGLFLDFDGTLSPTATDINKAHISEQAKATLVEMQSCVPLLAFVSGRNADDLYQRVQLNGNIYVGNHGMEQWVDGHVERAPEALAYRSQLEAVIEGVTPLLRPGMHIEDKVASLSIHYRQNPTPDVVKADLTDTVRALVLAQELDFFEGNTIFEVRPPVPINKGNALIRFVAEYDLDTALFFGDDVTDAEAMITANEMRAAGTCQAYGVGVLSHYTPQMIHDHATYFADSISGVEAFLGWILKARQETGQCL